MAMSLPNALVHRPPRLIAKVLSHAAATRSAGLSDVAEAIGVDDTTLMQYRSGRRRLSMQSFANLLAAYGDDSAIADAAVHYARVEYHPPKLDSIEAASDSLPAPAVERLRMYVERLPEEAVTTGRGLYLVSTDARALSLAVQFLVRSFEQARIAVCQMRGDARPSAADRRFALAAPVVVVERIDFLRDTVGELLRQRATLVRPLIVTSMQAPETIADPHLRRVVRSLTRRIDLSPSLPPNGSVPAESEQQ